MVLVDARLLLLLDRGHDAPGGAVCADDVFVSDGEEVALLDGEFLTDLGGGDDFFHVLDHLFVLLGLLRKFRHVYVFFP